VDNYDSVCNECMDDDIIVGDDNESLESLDNQVFVDADGAATELDSEQSVKPAFSGVGRMTLRDKLCVARDFAFSVNQLRYDKGQNLFFGALIAMTEIAKGNLETLQGIPLEGVLHNHLNMFSRCSTGQNLF
jgi:hypothetical protein